MLTAFTSPTSLPHAHHFVSPNPLITRLPPPSTTTPTTTKSPPPVPLASKRTTPLSLFRSNNTNRKVQSHKDPTTKTRVIIEAPARNKRRVYASNLISAPVDIVWAVLSDYDRLADYIPNLKISDVHPHPHGGIRVEQCGAQSVFGFEFRASVVMDMVEINNRSMDWRAIEFGLVESRDFKEFDGLWSMRNVGGKTALYYEVNIVPRGLVPVRAIEWRISEDVPQNMEAVRLECERRRRIAVADGRRQDVVRVNRAQS